MTYKLFNMNAGYYTSEGVYSLETQFEMTKELGFDGIWLTLWTNQAYDELEQISSLSEKYGIEVSSVYVDPHLSLGLDHPLNKRILDMLETLEGTSTVTIAIKTITPGLRPSDQSGDEVAIVWLKRMLEIAKRRDITILIYPHYSFWLETHEDALRLVEKINHPNLGIHFAGLYWFINGGHNLNGTLEKIAPYLKQVSLTGSRRDPNGWGGVATLEPLGNGKLDNFAILGKLKDIGFDGEIGFLNAEWDGDLYGNLERSLQVFRSMERRLEKFPHWAKREFPY